MTEITPGAIQPAVEVGKTYKIVPRYKHYRTLHVRVLGIIHTWTGETGDYIAVWGYRVRPAALNVSFGEAHSFIADRSQFVELTPPAS